MHDELAFLSIAEAAGRIQRRELSPVELVRATLERIAWLNPYLTAFITVTADQALAAAQEAEAEIATGNYRGPLHGIPVSLKDNIQTAGIQTTAASKALLGWVPDEDATVWARLKAAGAILVGKTNLHEFAMAGSLFNDTYGAARNPWDLTRTTNGSSSGSGSAVASGLSFASLGTETGASLLRPASFCGLAGFRATWSWISRYGVIPNAWTLDHIGPLTRSVADCALVTNVLLGHDPRDMGTRTEPTPDLAAAIRQGVRGLRIGVPWAHITGTVDDDVEAAFRAALDTLREAGATIVDLNLPNSGYAAAASTLIMQIEAAAWHRDWLQERGDGYNRGLRHRIELAAQLTAEDYLTCLRARRVIRDEVAAAFQGVDLMVGPTTATAATPLLEGFGPMRDKPLDIGAHSTNLHRLPSLLGLPALSVPCGFTENDLPIGLRFSGWRMHDATVFAAASAYQAATGWHTRRPPLNLDVPLDTPPPAGIEVKGADVSGGYNPELEPQRQAARRMAEIVTITTEPLFMPA